MDLCEEIITYQSEQTIRLATRPSLRISKVKERFETSFITGSSNLAKSLIVHDVSFTEWKFTHTTCLVGELRKKNQSFFLIITASMYEKWRCLNVQVSIGQIVNKGMSLRFLPTCKYKMSFFIPEALCNQESKQCLGCLAVVKMWVKI